MPPGARGAIRVENDQTPASGLRLVWRTRPEWDDWAQHSEGAYVLRTNVHGWSEEERWRTDARLGRGEPAEAAFRIHKTDLSIRPIWQQRAGFGTSPPAILEELARIQSTDVVLPLADGSGRALRLRCVVRPDEAPTQALLPGRLGLRLPERLRIRARGARMSCQPATPSGRESAITPPELGMVGRRFPFAERFYSSGVARGARTTSRLQRNP